MYKSRLEKHCTVLLAQDMLQLPARHFKDLIRAYEGLGYVSDSYLSTVRILKSYFLL